MRRLLLTLLLVACSEPSDPCPDGCSGPVDLYVDFVEVTLPRGEGSAAYGGDTLRVQAQVTNRGGKDFSSTAVLTLYSNAQFGIAEMELPRIRAGGRVLVDTFLVTPWFLRDAIARDSVGSRLEFAADSTRSSSDTNAWDFTWRNGHPALSKAFQVAPNTFQLQGVPAVLKYPSTQVIRFVATNRSQRAIPADSLHFCVEARGDCQYPAASAEVPSIGPQQTVTIPVALELKRQWHSTWWDRLTAPVTLLGCYGGQHYRSCEFAATDLLPDYERMCAVRRLPLATSLTATTTGRCGIPERPNSDDILSFEADAAAVYEVTTSSSSDHEVWVMTPTGDRVALTSRPARKSQSLRFNVPAVGRYYIIIMDGADYSIRVDRL